MDGIFYGQETSKVDSKGRIAVPAFFRAALGWTREKTVEVCVCEAEGKPALELAPIAFVNDLVVRASTPGQMTEPQRAMIRLMLPRIRRLTIDEDGRFILPEKFKTHAALEDQAHFAGIGRTFQIWTPKNFGADQEARRSAAGVASISLEELALLQRNEA
jgi:MraZ protein